MRWVYTALTAVALAACTYATGSASEPGFMAGVIHAWSFMVSTSLADMAAREWGKHRRAIRRGRD